MGAASGGCPNSLPALLAGRRAISVRLEWRALLFWVNERMPVVLVVYDAPQDQAYWLYVQEYFRRWRWARRAGPTTTATVHVPAGNVLNEAAVRLFARFRDECLASG